MFVEEVFQIKLHPIQKITIHLMGVADEFFMIATRGAAKSFLCGLGALVAFCLYPYSEIVITSSTIGQASKLVEKKIRDELIKKLSPYLLYMYEHEYIVITKSNTNDGGAYCVENKLNGSTITVLPCLDSSRGSRSTWNIYEEARLLKKNIIDSVFEPMGHARQAKYLLKKEYQTSRWLEKARSTYITSSRFSYEWFANSFRNTVKNYYLSKKELYIPFAEDIFAAISDGTRTWADYRKNKKTLSTIDFRCEILNEMISEGENSFFSYKPFKENQVLSNCFRPLTSAQILMGDNGNFPQKQSSEIRMVITDFSFAGDIQKSGGAANDNTVIMCMSLHWNVFHFERHIDYIETTKGGDPFIARRVKEVFFDYDADYLVMDIRSGGETLYNELSMPMEHPERGNRWNPSGFGIVTDQTLHVATTGKQEELKGRTVDKNALLCVIPFVGSTTTNSEAWTSLRKQIESNNIKLLVQGSVHQDDIENDGSFYEMTTEEYAINMLPYANTDELIQECVNLTAEYKEGVVKLKEPRSGFKDRAVCLAYGNYIASKIDTLYNKDQQSDDCDYAELELVF